MTADSITTISFPRQHNLEERSIKLVQGTVGLYFICLQTIKIPYPFLESRLIYIGMSESRHNSIGRRLRGHLMGQSGNYAIRNYAERHSARFAYHSFQLLKNLGATSLYEIESFFLSDFVRVHGAFPICNNQSGWSVAEPKITGRITVAWEDLS
jgi:hypothetical protein